MRLKFLAKAATLAALLSTTTCTPINVTRQERNTSLQSRIQLAPSEDEVKQYIISNANELARIGLQSNIDNIERGGIGLYRPTLSILEIENDLRHDAERFNRFVEGEYEFGQTLNSHCYLMAIVQGVNAPEYSAAYTTIAAQIAINLQNLTSYPLEHRREPAIRVWMMYDAHVLHNMYVKDPRVTFNEEDVIFHFHTHPGGGQPSPQDVSLSKIRPEVVISITQNGQYQIYYVKDEKTELLHSSTITDQK